MTTAPAVPPIGDIDALIVQATASPRRRQHHNIHASYDDPCQRFFNALRGDSYIMPHRHSGASDDETLIAIRGAFAAIYFSDDGAIDQIVHCDAGGRQVGTVVPVGRYHSVVPLSDPVVMLEIKAGPFDPDRAKEFAPWAPAEASPEAESYRRSLRLSCENLKRTTA